MPDCLHCRLWDFVKAEADGGRVDGHDLLHALGEMIADVIAKLPEEIASARHLELQIMIIGMERAKRRRHADRAAAGGEGIEVTVPGAAHG